MYNRDMKRNYITNADGMTQDEFIKGYGRNAIDSIINKNGGHHVWTVTDKGSSEHHEWSYASIIDKALADGLVKEEDITDEKTGKVRTYVDRRYINTDTNDYITVLVEVKSVNTTKFTESEKKQLFAYARLERALRPGVNVVCILVNIHTGRKMVWKYDGNEFIALPDTMLKSFEEYARYFDVPRDNNRLEVLKNATELNKRLHNLGIKENVRCPFVALLMFALKNKVRYATLNEQGAVVDNTTYTTDQIITAMNGIIDKAKKTTAPNIEVDKIKAVLSLDVVSNMSIANMVELLNFIERDIMRHIDENSTEGMDILSHFFLVFLKYVNREDKNQAFTPEHIAHFMCKLAGINRNSVVLDPTCGASTFLITAMNIALSKCETEEQRKIVKNNIHGIEVDENVYKIATTNMLIHSGGYSNIHYGSCFEKSGENVLKGCELIKKIAPNVILMNPPYNASRAQVSEEDTKSWGATVATDPSKGLIFVKKIADLANINTKLVVLLPQQCAIGSSSTIQNLKKDILKHHTLEAVFSLPNDLFYPGASAVVCCMVFTCGIAHADSEQDTFFGYYKNDGFEKRKYLGRVDVKNTWQDIEREWLYLYTHRATKEGICVTKKVTHQDEWCAEAYMDTDYSLLTDDMFEQVVRNYLAFQIQNGCKH